MFEDEDDEESINCLYCDGHWEWDNTTSGLKFISDVVAESQQTVFIPAAVVGPIEFKDNLDVLEQQKFRRRIQRKIEGEDDVVTLQDVKDIVLYTAPVALVTPMIVCALHTQTADRFLRALILYCQYYVQVSEIMADRAAELETKVPTQRSNEIETDYRDNLTDIRMLVAKEYCTMIIGGWDFKKLHHMGHSKKQQSMSVREAMLFEPLIRLSVQIVWVAIGRKNYQQLELEINRLFRTKKFNLVEHRPSYNEYTLSQREQNVLVGGSVRADRSMRMRSPFYNEIECVRDIDFRMFGLGLINFKSLNERLQYLESFLITEEKHMQAQDISLGIIGLNRNRFDILLREIQRQPDEGKISSHSYTLHRAVSSAVRSSRSARNSTTSRKSTTGVKSNLYLPIYIPRKETMLIPTKFPEESHRPLPINHTQRQRWINRTSKKTRRRSTMVKTQETAPK